MIRRPSLRRDTAAADLLASALPLVWRYAVGMSGRHAVARDVVHETFRLVSGSDTAVDLPSETQLLVRARLACRGGVLDDPDGAASRPATGVVEEASATTGLRAELADELTHLDADDREALVLLEVLGLDVERAAEIGETTPSDLHERRYRAHARLVARVVGEEL